MNSKFKLRCYQMAGWVIPLENLFIRVLNNFSLYYHFPSLGCFFLFRFNLMNDDEYVLFMFNMNLYEFYPVMWISKKCLKQINSHGIFATKSSASFVSLAWKCFFFFVNIFRRIYCTPINLNDLNSSSVGILAVVVVVSSYTLIETQTHTNLNRCISSIYSNTFAYAVV